MLALSTGDCCRSLETHQVEDPAIEDHNKRIIPAGIGDRALLAVLAYAGCRAAELARLWVRDNRTVASIAYLPLPARLSRNASRPNTWRQSSG
jgi:hypothetical protein